MKEEEVMPKQETSNAGSTGNVDEDKVETVRATTADIIKESIDACENDGAGSTGNVEENSVENREKYKGGFPLLPVDASSNNASAIASDVLAFLLLLPTLPVLLGFYIGRIVGPGKRKTGILWVYSVLLSCAGVVFAALWFAAPARIELAIGSGVTFLFCGIMTGMLFGKLDHAKWLAALPVFALCAGTVGATVIGIYFF